MKIRFDLEPPGPPVPSPCVGICTLGDDGLCIGCARTGNEIAAWPTMTDVERHRLLDALDERALGDGSGSGAGSSADQSTGARGDAST